MNDFLSHLLIQPKVVENDGLKFITDFMRRSKSEYTTVYSPESSNPIKLDTSIRNAKAVDCTPINTELKELYDNIVKYIINPFYEFSIRDSELPQLLKYDVGGHYVAHVDAYGKWQAPDGEIFWKKNMDRDLSTVLFLNDDFGGGELWFPDLKVSIKPEPGLLVCFPSSQYFVHQVNPVTKGTRYSMVTWMTVNGFPTLREVNESLEKKYNIKIDE